MTEKKELIKQTDSERFTDMVFKEFTANSGMIAWGPHQKKLAQHLFIKIDQQLADLEAKRISKKEDKKPPILWQNIDMKKLAIDGVHRIELGLDALIPNHIHPIPYFNSSKKKYDLDLRIGYEGKLFYRRAVAIEPPKDVRIELVYSSDKFKPIVKSFNNKIESYEFEITEPFKRGEVEGGFGYIIYDDETKNKLVLVSNEDLQKAETAGNDTFWKNYKIKMKLKTIVHRVTDHIQMDPAKITAGVIAAEKQGEEEFEREIEKNANKNIIDIEGEKVDIKTGEIVDELTPKQHELVLAVQFAGEEIVDKAWNDPACKSIPKTTFDKLNDQQCDLLMLIMQKIVDTQNKGPGF